MATVDGSSELWLEVRFSLVQDTEMWSLQFSDEFTMNFGAINRFDLALFIGLKTPFCLSSPNLFEFVGTEFVETLDELLGQLGALIKREIEHLLGEFVEVFHMRIVPVAWSSADANRARAGRGPLERTS